MSEAYQVEVPATSANLGPGYDSFGIALDIFDTLTLTIHDEPVDRDHCVRVSGQGAEAVPTDHSHLVMRVLLHVVSSEFASVSDELISRLGLDCVNKIPHSRGLGSSAAAVVAGIALASELGSHLGGQRLSRERMLELATRLEGHPDNAAPAIYGGLTISVSDPARAWQIPVQTIQDVTVIVPEKRLDTAIARSVIPPAIEHGRAAENSARAGLLVHAFVNDASVLMAATEDLLHQEFRREAYPESMSLVDRLRSHGLPAVISGAGPTVLVLSSDVDDTFVDESSGVLHTCVDLGGYRTKRLNRTQIRMNVQKQVN